MAMNTSSELIREFIEEAKAHIGTVEAGLLRLDEANCDAATLNEIFRAVHSIKGTAGFFELTKIVELSHVMEALFGRLRDDKIQVTAHMVDVLLEATDVLKDLICRAAEQEDRDVSEYVAAVKAFFQKEERRESPAGAGGLSAWDMWNQLTALEESANTEVAGVLPRLAPEPRTEPASPEVMVSAGEGPKRRGEPASESDAKARVALTGETVRVGVELLDDLLNIVGEMVLRRNQLLRIAQNAGKDVAQLDVVAQGIDNLTTSLQEKVMKTRMQPVANVFNKFPRIVRELTRKMDKEVDLVMEGMSVELDRSIIEALVDPITHLVRNALDHGIEPPKSRMAGNKPPAGTLVLHAYQESGRVIIDIRDDGAGIDIEKVKAKAVLKGWITDREAAAMRDTDVLSFIMRPGFSTAEQVTDISGRGVGMDVVKTNIEKLGGKVEIYTEKGAGTTFRLMLPLTLAIIPSFIVEAAGDAFAVPQANVKEFVLIQPGETSDKRIEFIQSSPVLRLRHQLLPLVYLNDVLGTSGGQTGGRQNWGSRFIDEGRTFRILVIKSGSLRYGLVVDAVYDTEEILVKPVPRVIGACGCYSGVTVLGDGRIAMIIDPESIRLEANLSETREAEGESVLPSGGDRGREQQYLLLFKCSGGEMLGIDLAMVARVEEIAASRVQKIGSKEYFTFQGQTIRIIRPEHYLPIARRKRKPPKLYVILPKFVKHTVGIIAEEICDAILTRIQLDESGVSGRGIIGSTLVDDRIVTLLNIYELFEKAAPEYYGLKTATAGKRVLPETGGSPGMKKARILLAEDTPFFARTIKSYLESDGFEVVTAENGREAFEMLSRRTVDVVISDIEMPLMNGLELVRTIRESETLRHLPVIALTSLGGEENREKGLRAGFDVYEFKLDRKRLLDSVHKVLAQKA
ncbi:chemotaxis protein CheW [Anaeroselena agilis]|uniref:histidine kinase n=1 Tax=Anaeroselena agilis TaxID=3063788 RepID=A0ABU3NSD3_9FIRM|nr:chemotaxis protein CheW [Selenomonadales bacterium 4137-cl]